MTGSLTGDIRHLYLYFGVCPGRMRHAVATSTERAYWHFGALVDVRVRSGVPVFYDRGIGGMTNLWHMIEYISYAFVTKKLRSATIEAICRPSRLIIAFHAVSSSNPLITSSRAPSKVQRARMLLWVVTPPCVGPVRGLCCLLARL